jgi:hypothetical protein
MSLVYSQGLGVPNNFVYSFYCVKRRLYYFSLSLKHEMFLGPNGGFSSRRRDTKKDTLADVFCSSQGLGVPNNFVYSFYCVKRRLYYFSLSLKHEMFLGPDGGFSSRRRNTKKDTLADVFCVLPGTRRSK